MVVQNLIGKFIVKLKWNAHVLSHIPTQIQMLTKCLVFIAISPIKSSVKREKEFNCGSRVRLTQNIFVIYLYI